MTENGKNQGSLSSGGNLEEKAGVLRLVLNGTGSMVTFQLDWQRMWLRKHLVETEGPMDPDSLKYFIFYNTGDVFNGYTNAFFTYYGLGLIFPKMSERVRSGVSFLVSTGSVVFTEGVIPTIINNPDLNDIPAGVFGAGLFLLANRYVRQLSDWYIARQQHISN